MQRNNKIQRYPISGAWCLNNFFWTIVLFFGSSGFLVTGFLCYFNISNNIQFFPQGFVMIFYGFLGLFSSFYLSLIVFWGLGSGFNEFNKQDSYIRIFRWGFPGKNRKVNLYYSWEDILGLSVKNGIFLRIRGKKEVPLTKDILTFEEMEKQASALAKFLQVSLNF
uniref:Photosystem I assembly protein Ycf4 n=1 Tax=Callipsygma wilsonis TaxID=2320807 RepID=A0A386B024_9CHLO|nr:photosystem I assembly protein Ycf4 [Callipsygma wilsonis]AYC65013.1 photosystem I assembly protein Ycf4 [Callipsygma wilsonis]